MPITAVESLVPKARKRSEALADSFESQRDHEHADGPDGERGGGHLNGGEHHEPSLSDATNLADEE